MWQSGHGRWLWCALILMYQPALWCSGIADGLQAWRWQLAAVRPPPGPGHESNVEHRPRLNTTQRPGHTSRKALATKKKALILMRHLDQGCSHVRGLLLSVLESRDDCAGPWRVAVVKLALHELIWTWYSLCAGRCFESFFSCDCLLAIKARSSKCLSYSAQVRLIGAKPIVQVRRWNSQVGPLRRSLIHKPNKNKQPKKQPGRSPPRQPGTPRPGSQLHEPRKEQQTPETSRRYYSRRLSAHWGLPDNALIYGSLTT